MQQWVMWRMELRNGKPTKVPYRPTNYRAKSDDPKTWSMFDQCVKMLTRFDGLGIMFANGLIGLDLDHHIDDAGYSSFAQTMIGRLQTYWEVSPSGHGLHALFFGTLPAGRRRNADYKIEIYSERRFFTMTGDMAIGSLDHVADMSDVLTTLYPALFPQDEIKPPAPPQPVGIDDQKLLDLARRRPEFDSLWTGDKSRYGGDESRADYALCKSLAYWTGNDAYRIDRLFRSSGLMRDKWDKRHSSTGATYGQMTINEAINHTSTIYDPNWRMTRIREAISHVS